MKHLTDELKKIDYNYEEEKLENQKKIDKFIKKFLKIRENMRQNNNIIREFDTQLKT